MLKFPREIRTKRFILRPLKVSDVTDRYTGWLREQEASQYISASKSEFDLADLRQYVQKRCSREDVLFLGIFDKKTGQHLGNVKFEPVNSELGYAIMGILVGEVGWRGKGVAPEVISASAEWLSKNCNIKQIVLGVSRTNVSAIRAYKKLGFFEEVTAFIHSVSPEGMTMVWHLKLPHVS